MTEAEGEGARAWRTFGQRVIYDDAWVWLGQIDVELPSGEWYWYHVVRLHRAAKMVLFDEQDRVLLLWRHRVVQDRWGWELPGGLVDDDEEPADAAVRELEEETGYRAALVEPLVTFQPMVSPLILSSSRTSAAGPSGSGNRPRSMKRSHGWSGFRSLRCRI